MAKIKSYRDKKTQQFAAGERVREFEGFRHQAEKRLEILDTALRLGKFFGTEPEFWMNPQRNYELRVARDAIGSELEKIPVHAT